MRFKIAPSILSADFACLGEQVRKVEDAGVDQIHVDVMDGHFVPNLSMGPAVVEALRRVTRLPLDVHLMVTDPGKYLEPFVKAGASHVSFHVEANGDHERMLAWLRERGVGCGLVLNPPTPVERVLGWLAAVDLVLVMTVHPGFSGQSFLGENLEKVRRLRAEEEALRRRGQRHADLDVQVDGGIGESTAVLARDAGANVFVAATAIFGAADPAAAARRLRGRIEARG
jgi:ribulose-phosphate 3-epimerase